MDVNKAIDYFKQEIRFCKEAPVLNGCQMTDDWTLMMEVSKLAVKALEAMQERMNPQILTLDELKQMDGEPVWVVDRYGNGRWAIVSFGLLSVYNGLDAYRHKPEVMV